MPYIFTTMIRHITTILATLLLLGCGKSGYTHNDRTLYVTITPLRGIVNELTCNDFDVRVLVPEGASPESFEPSARQLTELNDARLVFETGLINFEQSLTKSVAKERIVNLSHGIELIEGSCSHHHHHHAHGIDPHIWTSPRCLKQITLNIRDAVLEAYPDSLKYSVAADRIIERLDSLDHFCKEHIDLAGVDAMMIYHPAYTYYAHDYGIEQIAIEHDGKEPTPKQLTTLSERAASLNIGAILIQPQYNADKVRPIAEQIEVEIITTNPLAEDIEGEIRRITEIICRDNE